MKTLLSEFNYQQQDLDAVKDDLGLLKFGFALLQDSNYKLSKDSIRQLFQLKNIALYQGESRYTLMDFATILSTLETQSGEIATTLDSVETSADQCVELIQVAQHPCGGSGWKKVVDLDMANPSHTCPMGWTETDYSKRTCGRTLPDRESCSPAVFTVADLPSYSRVCGRISAYVFGGPDAFNGYSRDSTTPVTQNFADGVVLYYGSSPAVHIWSFVVGVSESPDSPQARDAKYCPCDRRSASQYVPPFVGVDYFCESQNAIYPVSGSERLRLYPEDIMWDGENCLDTSNCCEFNRPPYFVKTLAESTSADITASLCFWNNARGSNLAVEVFELYVHE